MKITQEQKNIVEMINYVPFLIVNAYAGTGKTTTFIEMIKAYPQFNFLYLCFNRALKEEFKAKVKGFSNIKVENIHSLAMKAIEYQKFYKYKEQNFLENYGEKYNINQNNILINLKSSVIKDIFFLSDPREGTLISYIMNDYCKSLNEDIDEKILNTETIYYYQKNENFLQLKMPSYLKLTKKYWDIMNDPTNFKIPLSFDGIIKKFSLMGSPKKQINNIKGFENIQCILVDEAQDIMLAVEDFVLKQNQAKICIVGDKFQSIYAWNEAHNFIEKCINTKKNAKLLNLTQSFRFGEVIANLANLYLNTFFPEKNIDLKGNKDINSNLCATLPENEDITIINRTNISILLETLDLYIQRKKYYFNNFDNKYKELIQNICIFKEWSENFYKNNSLNYFINTSKKDNLKKSIYKKVLEKLKLKSNFINFLLFNKITNFEYFLEYIFEIAPYYEVYEEKMAVYFLNKIEEKIQKGDMPDYKNKISKIQYINELIEEIFNCRNKFNGPLHYLITAHSCKGQEFNNVRLAKDFNSFISVCIEEYKKEIDFNNPNSLENIISKSKQNNLRPNDDILTIFHKFYKQNFSNIDINNIFYENGKFVVKIDNSNKLFLLNNNVKLQFTDIPNENDIRTNFLERIKNIGFTKEEIQEELDKFIYKKITAEKEERHLFYMAITRTIKNLELNDTLRNFLLLVYKKELNVSIEFFLSNDIEIIIESPLINNDLNLKEYIYKNIYQYNKEDDIEEFLAALIEISINQSGMFYNLANKKKYSTDINIQFKNKKGKINKNKLKKLFSNFASLQSCIFNFN